MPPADQPAQAPRTALDDYDLASLALCAFEGVTQPRITRTKWKDGIDLEIATPGLRRFADAVVERELSSARAEAERLREALEKVERWQFPPTGKFWESGNPVSYIAAYGSNGERDYMREVARAALAATRKEERNA